MLWPPAALPRMMRLAPRTYVHFQPSLTGRILVAIHRTISVAVVTFVYLMMFCCPLLILLLITLIIQLFMLIIQFCPLLVKLFIARFLLAVRLLFILILLLLLILGNVLLLLIQLMYLKFFVAKLYEFLCSVDRRPR